MIRDVHPGSRIRIFIFYPSRIQGRVPCVMNERAEQSTSVCLGPSTAVYFAGLSKAPLCALRGWSLHRRVPWAQCCESGSEIRCILDPWIRDGFFPDPGSQTHIFESLVTIFWVQSSIILWKLAQIFFFSISKGYKKGTYENKFFPPLSFAAVFGSGMGKKQDPG